MQAESTVEWATEGTLIEFPSGLRYPVAKLTIESFVERARSDNAVRPKPGWEHTDPAGHVHRWDSDRRDATIPTARRGTRHMPCDGSCGGVCQGEGYHVPEWRCRTCDAVIEPGYVPDELARGIGVAVTQMDEYAVEVGPSERMPVMPVMDEKVSGCTLHFKTPDPDHRGTKSLAQMELPDLRWSGDVAYDGDRQVTVTMSGSVMRIPSRH